MGTPGSRPRVLIIAEAANPEWVSVPLVGWSLSSALRDVADVHIVTQVRNREAILRAGLEEGKDFTAIDSEAIAAPMHKLASFLRMGEGKGWTTLAAINALTYPYFERLVWKRFGAEISAGHYDIVHRITPLSPTTASPIASKVAQAGVPFVLGPLNGGVPWPPSFDAERRREREWLSYVRGSYKLSRRYQRTLRNCAAVIAGSRHTADELPLHVQDRVIWLPENAIDPDRFNLISKQDLTGPIKACFIGRLVPYKGPDMLLAAAAGALRSGSLTLDIIGDGPMRQDLASQAEQLGISDMVTFHGNLPHAQVQTVAAEANLLTFPSIREFGGGVVLEAMALGVVPMIVDYAGPGELVTDQLGFKIPIGTRAEIIDAFSATLEKVIRDPSHLQSMSAVAREKVWSDFTWSAKAHQVARVYEWVMNGGDKPTLLS